MTGRRAIRGGLALGVGQLAAQGLSFIRNVIIARALSPSDFGIAATIAMTITFVEMASSVEPSTLLIQATDGDNPRLQDAAHCVEVVRAVINSVLLLVLAWPLAAVFHVPEARWAFYLLACVPLLRGFGHLDRMRLQRDLNYTPYVTVEVGTHLILVILAWPLSAWLRNYTVMLWLMLAQSALISAGGHAFAVRRYRWNWRRRDLARFYSFGWPLLLNGLVLFAILQGDRAVVGSKMTMTDLGVYSVATVLTSMPATAVFRVVGPVLLPLLARVQHDRAAFIDRYRFCTAFLTLCGLCISVPFIIAGEACVTLTFGRRYYVSGALLAWLAAAQAIRMTRGAPMTASLAYGDARNQLVSNLWRAAVLPMMLLTAVIWHQLVWIAVVGTMGELIALAAAALRLRRKHGMPIRVLTVPTAVAVGLMLLTVYVHYLAQRVLSPLGQIVVAGIFTLIVALGFLASFGALRQRALQLAKPWFGQDVVPAREAIALLPGLENAVPTEI